MVSPMGLSLAPPVSRRGALVGQSPPCLVDGSQVPISVGLVVRTTAALEPRVELGDQLLDATGRPLECLGEPLAVVGDRRFELSRRGRFRSPSDVMAVSDPVSYTHL